MSFCFKAEKASKPLDVVEVATVVRELPSPTNQKKKTKNKQNPHISGAFIYALSRLDESDSSRPAVIRIQQKKPHRCIIKSTQISWRTCSPSITSLRPQNVVRILSQHKTIPFATPHSSGFISWPIFALLLITEAVCDPSAVTSGENWCHRKKKTHFFEGDIKSALYLFSSVSERADCLHSQIIN